MIEKLIESLNRKHPSHTFTYRLTDASMTHYPRYVVDMDGDFMAQIFPDAFETLDVLGIDSMNEMLTCMDGYVVERDKLQILGNLFATLGIKSK